MKIVIFFSGPSSEAQVSESSKGYFYEKLQNHDPLLARWNDDFSVDWMDRKCSLDEFLELLTEGEYILVNSTHGEYGEDGWLQERLEKLQIPFTGPSSAGAKVSIDKSASAAIAQEYANAIPSCKFTATSYSDEQRAKFKFPLFLKPNAKGSSVNVYKVNDARELDEKLEEMAKEEPDEEYVLQPAVEGTEVSIGVVCDEGRYYDLEPTEIIPRKEFFDYEAKYTQGMSEEITPARLSSEVRSSIKSIANDIHSKLDLGFYSRSDFIVDGDGKIWYLETNSLPGMTETSLLPQQLRYAQKERIFFESLLRNVNG